MGLAEAAIEFACEVLTPGGAFVCKVFQGGTERDLLDLLKKSFAKVKHVKPPASRANRRSCTWWLSASAAGKLPTGESLGANMVRSNRVAVRARC